MQISNNSKTTMIVALGVVFAATMIGGVLATSNLAFAGGWDHEHHEHHHHHHFHFHEHHHHHFHFHFHFHEHHHHDFD